MYGDGTIPAAFKVTESTVTSKGVIIVNYERAGTVPTGRQSDATRRPLRANGHLVAEVPLQPPETAVTLSWKAGKVATTDGPNAETKVWTWTD